MKKLLDAGTTWSKIMTLSKDSVINPELEPFGVELKELCDKKGQKLFASICLIPSKNLRKVPFKFDFATGHMVQDLLNQDAVYVNEILALAYGAMKLIPELKDATVLDIGSRDAKWIKFKDGKYSDLDWNSACASSTGATVEMLCNFYGVDVNDLSVSDAKYSLTCGIFGMEKIMDDIASGQSEKECISRYIHGLAYNMWNFAKRPDEIFLSGGFCQNQCFVKSLEKYSKVTPLGRNVLLNGLF